MSESNTGTPSGETKEGAPAPTDELKNLKAEMNRKLDNTNAQLAALLAQLNKAPASTQATPAKEVSVFDDEKAFKQSVKDEAVREAEERITRKQQEQARYASVQQQVISDYPELMDETSAIAKRANEIYLGLPENERRSPVALKAAADAAALELNMRPKSKRSSQSEGDDSFALGSSGMSTANKARKKGDELSQETLDFAALAGLDVSDEKVIKRLKERATRKNWKQYSS